MNAATMQTLVDSLVSPGFRDRGPRLEHTATVFARLSEHLRRLETPAQAHGNTDLRDLLGILRGHQVQYFCQELLPEGTAIVPYAPSVYSPGTTRNAQLVRASLDSLYCRCLHLTSVIAEDDFVMCTNWDHFKRIMYIVDDLVSRFVRSLNIQRPKRSPPLVLEIV